MYISFRNLKSIFNFLPGAFSDIFGRLCFRGILITLNDGTLPDGLK